MPFSSGVYTLPNPALVTGEVVSATENNTTRNDIAGAFNVTMLRNGTSTATANLPMGGYKLTGLGAPTTNGDALSYGAAAVVSTLGATGDVTLSGGTANGVAYLNGSKVLTTGSALTFDGTNFATTGTASATKLIPTGGAATGNGMYLPASNTLAWSNNGSETMRLDSSGNLGLGVTPSAWNSGISAFEMPGGVSLSYNSGYTNLSNNTYLSSTGWKYKATGAASLYSQNAGTHVWYNVASGTAGNAISFTQAMTLDASGNLGIGTSSPSEKLHVSTGAASAFGRFQGSTGNLYVGVNSSNDGELNTSTNNNLVFKTFGTERMRIDSSGNLLVGSSSFGLGKFRVSGGSSPAGYFIGNGNAEVVNFDNAANGNYRAIRFLNNNFSTIVGAIDCTTTSTTYATSSDYRLKENIQPMQNALEVVQQLNPVTYTWKADGSDGQGFIAHELQAVVPDCVTGEKDAVDKDGKPVYQGIDTSFLVATLTKAIQEQQEQIEQLKSEVAALKGV